MNLKKIFCLVIAVSVSSHALAMEIYHGRVIKEKSWSTNGEKVVFAKHDASSMAMSGSPQAQSMYTDIHSIGTNAVGEPVSADGYSYVSVRNDTADNETYSVLHSTCVALTDKIEHCAYHQKDLELDSGGYFHDNTSPRLTVKFDKPGIYPNGENTPASALSASDIVVL
jgi:hypothetical protein